MLNPFVHLLLPVLVLVLACLVAWLVEGYSHRVLPAWLSIPLAGLFVIVLLYHYVEVTERFEQRPLRWVIEGRTELQPGPEGYLVVVGDDGWATCWRRDGTRQLDYHPEIVPGGHAVAYEFAKRSVNPRYRWLDDAVVRRVILVPPDAKIKTATTKLPIPAADLPKERTP